MTPSPALPATVDDVVALLDRDDHVADLARTLARPAASGPGLRPACGVATGVRPAMPHVRGAH